MSSAQRRINQEKLPNVLIPDQTMRIFEPAPNTFLDAVPKIPCWPRFSTTADCTDQTMYRVPSPDDAVVENPYRLIEWYPR